MCQVFSYKDVAMRLALDKMDEGYIVSVQYVAATRYGTPWHVTYVKGG